LSGVTCGAYIIYPGEHAARREPAGDCVERSKGVDVGSKEWCSGFDPVWRVSYGRWGGVVLAPVVSRN
jgi:hypothetical protein